MSARTSTLYASAIDPSSLTLDFTICSQRQCPHPLSTAPTRRDLDPFPGTGFSPRAVPVTVLGPGERPQRLTTSRDCQSQDCPTGGSWTNPKNTPK
eukprot:910621-Pyramimonas_sp.AAC.1